MKMGRRSGGEVKLVEDYLSMLLGVEEIGYTCGRYGRQVGARKYALSLLVSEYSADRYGFDTQRKFARFPEVF